ncbi:MAG: ribose-5-phosphate isomerase RpiA [Thermoplasmatota archaeon]
MLQEKRNAGFRAAEYVEDGMVVGLGTGSTAKHAVEKIGERIREEGLDIVAIPTSENTKMMAEDFNIPLTTLDEVKKIDVTIDGADEVDDDKNLIKGGGGALLREKMVAFESDFELIVVDPTKIVEKLGVGFDLPVEIIPHWKNSTIRSIEMLGCTSNIRMHDSSIFKTDNHNYIVDCSFEGIDDPETLSNQLNNIPGVIENGLFIELADKIIIGKKEGFEEF